MNICVYCGVERHPGSEFCTACGCSLSYDIGVGGRLAWTNEQTQRERVYQLADVGRTVGRDDLSDIVLEDDQASGKHATIEMKEGAFWISDLGSRNGTFVNGVRVDTCHRLASKDLIKIGSTVLRFTV